MKHRKHILRRLKIPFGSQNFLSVLEGIEGGFAISAGIVAGLSFAAVDRRLLLITAGISILVNGFNASAIKYSSEHYADELDGHEKRDVVRSYLVPAIIEFMMYLAVCLLTLIPLFIMPSIFHAVAWCVAITLTVLFAAGAYRGEVLQTRPLRDGLELMLLGGLIVAVGATAGFVLSQ